MSKKKPTSKPATIVEIKPSEITTLASATRYLDSLTNFERTRPSTIDPAELKLDRMRALLDLLGNPHQSLRCIHVAGSKGKGSVCEMVSAAISGCGYTVGLYTSPHLSHVRERFRINNKPISQREFPRMVAKIAQAAQQLAPELGALTYFEATTALALAYFAEKEVDAAAIEVGLGGRLDSTNVITPAVTCITSLQLEHTQILGDTIDKIAAEKAGIFKPGVTAITIPQHEDAMPVLVETSKRVGCELRVVSPGSIPAPGGTTQLDFNARFEADAEHGPHTRVSLHTPRVSYEHIAVPLKGEHQAFNAGIALAVLDALTEQGLKLPEIGVVDGLNQTSRDGKMELVHEAPRVMIDGAHTPESITALVKAIGACVPTDSMAVVFGCASDKNIDQMLTEIGRGADKIVFTKSATNPRAADPAKLASQYTELTGKDATSEPTVKEAINAAARAVSRDDLILVTGSFYIAGEAKALLKDKQKQARAGV